MTEIARPSDLIRPAVPFDPAELPAELFSEEFWIENASRFLACAAHFLGDDAGAAQAAVLTATESILSGDWRCPAGMSSVQFVLSVISQVVAMGRFP